MTATHFVPSYQITPKTPALGTCRNGLCPQLHARIWTEKYPITSKLFQESSLKNSHFFMQKLHTWNQMFRHFLDLNLHNKPHSLSFVFHVNKHNYSIYKPILSINIHKPHFLLATMPFLTLLLKLLKKRPPSNTKLSPDALSFQIITEF